MVGLGTVLGLVGPLCGRELTPRQQSNPSILFVASQHMLGSGGARFLVDPKYKGELEQRGWAARYATLSALRWGKLKRFNVVVLQQHPDVKRYRLQKMFRKACGLLEPYVSEGGCVLVFGDLHRGRIYGNLNRLLRPFGAETYYQVIEEKDPEKQKSLTYYCATKAFVTRNVEPSPITEGVVFNLRKPWSKLPWGGKGFDTFI